MFCRTLLLFKLLTLVIRVFYSCTAPFQRLTGCLRLVRGARLTTYRRTYSSSKEPTGEPLWEMLQMMSRGLLGQSGFQLSICIQYQACERTVSTDKVEMYRVEFTVMLLTAL